MNGNNIYTVHTNRFPEGFSLSLRGRATFMNTLILSQLWCTLQIFNPTAAFFSQLHNLTYQFVWKHKYSFVSFDHLCRPIRLGGVRILNPEMQHLILQFKFLHSLLQTDIPPEDTVSPFILTCLSETIPLTNAFPLASFFIPEYRQSSITNRPTCILNTMYKAFDSFGFKFNFAKVFIQALLQYFTIQYFFKTITPTHWLLTHNQTPFSVFFSYNYSNHNLVLNSASQCPSHYYPRLRSQSHFSVILTHTAPELHSPWWQYISTPFFDIDEDHTVTLVSQVLSSPHWLHFSPVKYRQSILSASTYSISTIPYIGLKLFWTSKMHLPARDL
ncbi:MAG: hypothetical protein EXX96DRAFT_638318 [Benjaminiella poitrasii]|nr:MAG: hypothetical protein EXX96DRAFT_638318 [Benjaminiella poitrasii]